MESLVNALKRHRYGVVFEATGAKGDFDSGEVDCPSILELPDCWIMAYTGWDGKRLSIGLARSVDLLNWERLGVCLESDNSIEFEAGGISGPRLFRDGPDYYLFYTGFPEKGYEGGAGAISFARSRDLSSWEKLGKPVMTPCVSNPWEAGGLYRPFVMKYRGDYLMFYNAKDSEPQWTEQTGFATSSDLLNWEKHAGNPILPIGPAGAIDSRFASDPCIRQIDGTWLMFYFGYDGEYACECAAVSDDLMVWRKYKGNPIIGPGSPGSYDALYAHKPEVLYHDGIWYHYYCSVGNGKRAIALATSRPLSK